ncbi:MAG TPA: methylmalonyl-CoA mutase subunit beta [Pseudoneobacillus sp.]|nr:methylmalonyl-CoA mutase subunit beta [Pseudoneobacillus sp.]
MRNETFLPSSLKEWEIKAEDSLKGKKLDSLYTDTYENIILKPLYLKQDSLINSGFPGGTDYRRGLHALGYHSNPWKISQEITYQNAEELEKKLADALEKGQTALSFKVKKALLDDTKKIEDILNPFINKVPFAIETEGFQSIFLSQLRAVVSNKDVCGYVAEDPLSFLVKKGSLPYTLNSYMDTWAETIIQTSQELPNLKTILIDTTPYHNGGANAIQELALSLATGVFYLEELGKRGLRNEEFFEKVIFKFQIGSNFFLELAKIRAARVLWDKLGEAYNISPEKRGMEIIAETSSFNKSLYDEHVNILRAGNEAFAAVLGGVQFLQVGAFNELGKVTSLSERLARNTQLILKEESHLKHIVDPAGGSWYIESLTGELAEKAWEYFLSIDEKDGILEVLQSNWIQTEISEVLHKRLQDVYTRKQSIIGTNVYANLQEKVKHSHLHKSSELSKGEYHTILPIQSTRLSETFENLRYRTNQLENKNPIGLLCLGELKQFKARADFIAGLLSAGGLGSNRSNPLYNHDDAHLFLAETNLKHYIICSSNEKYNEIGPQEVKKLKELNPSVKFYLAGLPEKDTQAEWLEAGIEQFVHVKINCYEFLTSIMTELEEV